MNLLIFSDQYYPLGGGIEQYLRGLGKELTIQGHKVTFLTRTVDGCQTEEVMTEGSVLRTDLLLDAIPNPQAVLDRWQNIIPLINSVKPDVVYANHHTSVAAIKACKELSIPVIYGCHGWGLLCPLKIRFLKPDNSLCYNERSVKNCSQCYKQLHLPSRITGISTSKQYLKIKFGSRKDISTKVAQYDQFQEILESADARIILSRKWSSFFDKENTFTIPLGIDTDLFARTDPAPFLQKYGIEGKYILLTSRIHNTKGHEWAIRALNHLPNEIKLVIAGNTSLFIGPKREENMHTRHVRQIIDEFKLKDRIIFTGFLNNEELIQAYSGAVATIVPSIWLEAFAYVTIEAMSCACPVVVTESCGSADLVANGIEGYVVSRMDPQAIAEAVLKIMPYLEQMGKAAREKVVRRLNWSKIAHEVFQVVKTATKNS
jgi:glycosyltransferase involved in cell wall biosynthesis